MINFRKPAHINATYTEGVRMLAGMILDDANIQSPLPMASIYVANLVRGHYKVRHDQSAQQLTVPIWVVSKGFDYLTYYVAHELAHGLSYKDTKKMHHDQNFMYWFKKLCPVDFQHFELNYKPRNAKAAGISKPKS